MAPPRHLANLVWASIASLPREEAIERLSSVNSLLQSFRSHQQALRNDEIREILASIVEAARDAGNDLAAMDEWSARGEPTAADMLAALAAAHASQGGAGEQSSSARQEPQQEGAGGVPTGGEGGEAAEEKVPRADGGGEESSRRKRKRED